MLLTFFNVTRSSVFNILVIVVNFIAVKCQLFFRGEFAVECFCKPKHIKTFRRRFWHSLLNQLFYSRKNLLNFSKFWIYLGYFRDVGFYKITFKSWIDRFEFINLSLKGLKTSKDINIYPKKGLQVMQKSCRTYSNSFDTTSVSMRSVFSYISGLKVVKKSCRTAKPLLSFLRYHFGQKNSWFWAISLNKVQSCVVFKLKLHF